MPQIPSVRPPDNPPRVRCRWRLRLTARDLDDTTTGDLGRTLSRITAHMPADADVLLEISGRITWGNGSLVGRYLQDARTIEVVGHGAGFANFVATLTAASSERDAA